MNATPPRRRSIRLPGYDYSQPGAYFITIVTANRIARFGTVQNGEMHLNWLGEVLKTEWQNLPSRFIGLSNESFVVMPNHIHGILIFEDPHTPCPGEPNQNENAHSRNVPGLVGVIVRTFKSLTTYRYSRMRSAGPGSLWQPNYYEHIVRSQADLDDIHAYILNNPLQWEQDRENPALVHKT